MIEDLKSEVVKNLGNLKISQNNTQKTNCVLVHGSSKQKEEMTDEAIINTLNEKLDSEITFGD